MKFRTRLLILLLLTALVPLAMSSLFQSTSIKHFGKNLATDTRDLLNTSAETLLHTLVNDYGRILKRDKTMALLTLEMQAQAVENRLSSPPSEPADPIFFSADYAASQRQPQDLIETTKHLRLATTGEQVPIPISYSQQVIFIAGGKKADQVRHQLSQLSSMPKVYQALHQIQPDLFLWQYTALESGIHSSYPGKGGYPDDYDPRQRQWYKQAVAAGKPIQLMNTDLATGILILTLAQPIYSKTGKLVGVTALDIDYRQFFADWDIPDEWTDATESMVLSYHNHISNPSQQLEILLRKHSNGPSRDWRIPVEHEYLTIPKRQRDLIQADFINSKTAVRKIYYQGQDTLWAYGSQVNGEPFPLLIVPHQKILARASKAEIAVNQQISLSLKLSALLTIAVVAIVILLAIIRARKVTEPIMQLATAASQLADGNFDVRVDIHTSDELQNLGNVFNNMGHRLKERDQMKQSLALAKEIQQQLLPDAAPDCINFDLAAQSIYCDETGGDYFDFINIKNCPDQYLGIAVGDVSGHGIGSALVMATARGLLHSLAEQYSSEETTLISELNRHLCRDTANAH
ncbi:MAG: HAMP domain-containing protein, partial [Desulfuromonadales bacterium]|nr:HAMP domain-containing protein [Desulfuromonadales bacterium]